MYLDHAATAPPEEAVIAAMSDCMRRAFANPSSPYGMAGAARKEQRLCRQTLANMLGCDSQQLVFTSGGTESNNHALHAAAGKHVVLAAIEHSSVSAAARLWGCEVSTVLPDANGVTSPESVQAALRPDTALICVQYANNETGVLQPVQAIGHLARERGIPFHVDAVQAFGHVPVSAACCDSMSLSAHKLYGPRGVGALYMRTPLAPLIAGGGQERGLRAGTENTAAICGFRVAAQLAAEDMEARALREARLLNAFVRELRAAVPNMRVLGENAPRLPAVLAVCLPQLLAETAIARLDLMGIQVSGGAACASRTGGSSHVYRSMGLGEHEAKCVLRISVGRHTGDLAPAARAIAEVYARYAGR